MQGARRAIRFATIAMVASILGCASDSTPAGPGPLVDTITLTVDPTGLTVGQTIQATAAAIDALGAPVPDVTVTWQSSNTDIATVSASGLIAAVAPGTATITASAQGKSRSVNVTVNPAPVASVSVALSASMLTLGDGATATATLRDAGGTALEGRALAWESSNANVATISSTGAISTHNVGTTSINATSEGVTGSAILTVQFPPVHSVTVALTKSMLIPGESTTASATLRDESNEIIVGPPIAWSSSNPEIATVTASGTVTGVAAGSASIIARAESVTGQATITVTANGGVGGGGGTPTALAIATQPASVVSGQPFGAPPVIQVRDADGALVATATNVITASIASGAGTITVGSHATAVNGVATFTSLRITGSGPHTLAFSASDLGSVTSNTFTVGAALSTSQAQATVSGMVGTALSATPVTASGGVTPYAFALSGGTLPSGLSFNTSTGKLSGAPTAALATMTFTVTVTDASHATSSKTFQLTVNTAVPPLTTTRAVASKTGTVNSPIGAFIPVTASGGTLPYTFALSGGSLPAGLTFNTSSGQVSGTPTAAMAAKTFTVTVTDASHATSSKTFQLTVNAAVPPLVTTQAIATVNGTVGTALSVTPVTASGGVTPYAFALSGGSLPGGLAFNTGTGKLSGTPTAALSSRTFTVTVTDAASATSSRTFTLAVAAAPSTDDECASPQGGWIFCDDFESNRLSSYYEYDDAGGKFVRTASSGVNGSTGMRATYTTGQSGAGSLHLAFGRTPGSYFRPVDAGTANYREIYWRFYVRREPGWVGNGPDKLTRATIFAKSDWSQAMIAHGWTSSNRAYLALDPASGTDASGNLVTSGYNDFSHLRWLGLTPTSDPLEDQAHVGTWACYEFHARLNDAGQSNGVFELTVDGQLMARKTGMNWIGSYNAYGINAVFLEQYQNDGAPAANVRVLDNFVVSTQPIGCLP